MHVFRLKCAPGSKRLSLAVALDNISGDWRLLLGSTSMELGCSVEQLLVAFYSHLPSCRVGRAMLPVSPLVGGKARSSLLAFAM